MRYDPVTAATWAVAVAGCLAFWAALVWIVAS